MQKINFQNLPSTTTPINATNLNAIQTNVENVFNGSETMGSIVVENISSKNMFNGIIMQGTPDNLTYNLRLHSDDSIKVVSGKTYTLSTNAPSTFQIRLANYQSVSSFADATNYESDGSVTLTTTTSGSLVVLIKKTNDGTITPSDVANYHFQIEEGSSATSYTPYQQLDLKNITNDSNGNIAINGNAAINGNLFINGFKNVKVVASDTLINGQSKTYSLNNSSAIFLIFVHANGNNSGGLELAYYNGQYHTTIKAPTYVTFSYTNGSVTATPQYTNRIVILEI